MWIKRLKMILGTNKSDETVLYYFKELSFKEKTVLKLMFGLHMQKEDVSEFLEEPLYEIDYAYNHAIETLKENLVKEVVQEKPSLSYPDNLIYEIIPDFIGPLPPAKEENLKLVIKDLSEIKRDALMLHFKESLTNSEIAKIQDVPKSTVSSRLKSALRSVKRSEFESDQNFYNWHYLVSGPDVYQKFKDEKIRKEKEEVVRHEKAIKGLLPYDEVILEDLSLPPRAYNMFQRVSVHNHRITTLQDILDFCAVPGSDILSKEKLLKIRNVGEATARDIINALKAVGVDKEWK